MFHQVAKNFIEKVKPKAIGQEIIESTSPGQMVVKIVNDQLIELLGKKQEDINLKASSPISLLMLGQGSENATSANSYFIERKYKKCMLVSLDVYRPAAQEQLKILADANNILNLPIVQNQKPTEVEVELLMQQK